MEEKKTNFYKEARSLLLIVLIAFAIRILLIEPFFVPTGSMKHTILEGDYIFATKYNYGYSRYSIPFAPNLFNGKRVLFSEPQRGDVIIFRPPNNMSIRYIKRLIGLPGDKIQMQDGILYINDIPMSQKYINHYLSKQGTEYQNFEETLSNGKTYNTLLLTKLFNGSNTGEFVVPDKHYFFLGDNRNESADSRFDLGFVPEENLIAKAQFIYFSTDDLLFLDNPFSLDQLKQVYKWLASIRWGRLFNKF